MDLKEEIKEVILNNTETWFDRRLKTAPLNKYYKIRANDIDALVSELAKMRDGNNASTSENSLHKQIVMPLLPTDVQIEEEAKCRQLDGAEPYSFAAGARWIKMKFAQLH